MLSQLLDWADKQPAVVVETGTGAKYPTLRFRIQTDHNSVTFIVFWPDEKDASLGANLYFGSLAAGIPAFLDAEARKDIARKIHDEIDAQFDPCAFEKYPSFKVENLRAVDAVFRLMDMIAQRAATGQE